MTDLGTFEVWFVTGSQHLYGPETLETVAEHSRTIAAALDASSSIPVRVLSAGEGSVSQRRHRAVSRRPSPAEGAGCRLP